MPTDVPFQADRGRRGVLLVDQCCHSGVGLGVDCSVRRIADGNGLSQIPVRLLGVGVDPAATGGAGLVGQPEIRLLVRERRVPAAEHTMAGRHPGRGAHGQSPSGIEKP